MKSNVRRVGSVLGTGAATAAVLGLDYAALTWSRYGRKLSQDGRPDPVLDRYIASYEVREYHETRVAAPAEVTFDAARQLDFNESGLIRAIFKGRELLMGSAPAERQSQPDFLSKVIALGWRILAEEPGRELIMGAVTQPWLADVEFRGLAPEEFAAFNEPGYAKIAWTMAVDPAGPDRSVFWTETRVATTDPESRRRFRRYWFMVSPGVVLIRHEMLRLVRRKAARREHVS